jgi:hypothetical protein
LVRLAVNFECSGEVHESAAFCVDRATGRSELADGVPRRLVVGELFGVEFRVAAAEIDPVDVFG